MLITLISHEDQIVKERAADTACTAKPFCGTRHPLTLFDASWRGQLNLVEVNGIEPMTPLLAKQVLSQLSYTTVRQNRCDGGGSGWIRTNDPLLIKTVL